MTNPRFFILAASEEQLVDKLNGCDDILRAAKFKGLKIVDRDNLEQHSHWYRLVMKRNKQA